MKKHQYSKLGLIAFIAVLAASIQVRAADMAWAAGARADIYVAATEASAAVAAASGSGGKAVQDAQAKLESINKSIQAANEAYAAMEAAGDGDATAAREALSNARQQALGGAAPVTASASNQGGYADGLPNIYDVPWQTDGRRTQKESQYQTAKSASGEGGDSFAERDATPE